MPSRGARTPKREPVSAATISQGAIPAVGRTAAAGNVQPVPDRCVFAIGSPPWPKPKPPMPLTLPMHPGLITGAAGGCGSRKALDLATASTLSPARRRSSASML